MRYRSFYVMAWWILLVFSGYLFAPPIFSQINARATLIGFVYEKDRLTPVSGVKIVLKNVMTGSFHESPPSDQVGMFKLEGLGPGVYAVGVSGDSGSFNTQDYIGLAANETAKIVLSLQPFKPEEVAAAATVARDQQEKGESYIGRVVRYIPERKEAEIFIERGLIQAGDRIHIKGRTTDFYENVKTLIWSATKVERVLAGQSAFLPIQTSCQPGDFVYVVCKQGMPPLFLAPLGIAAIVAGSATLVTLEEEEVVSPYRVKK